MKRIIFAVLIVIMLAVCGVSAQAATNTMLQYDDYYDTGDDVRIVSQTPLVGDSVLELSENGVHAVGLGTAVIESGGETINIGVEKAAVNIALMMGQSNAGNNCGNLDEAIECQRGTAYCWNAVSKSKPDELIKQKHYRSSFAAQWYKLSCLNGAPEKTAIVHIYGVTYRDGVSITSDAPFDTQFGWINKNESGFYLSYAGEQSLKAFLNCYNYFASSPFYTVSGSGVYWFQGEHDPNVDKSADDGSKYIDYYENLWQLLKSGSGGKLTYFAAFRVKGSGSPANYTLRFCDSLNAQYKAANETEDMYIASNITEQWYAEKEFITVNASEFMGADGNISVYKFDELYGYNKAHYYQKGYNILGMDAAYNMYRTLHDIDTEPDCAVLLERSGKAETRVECKAGSTVNLQLNQTADFCINLKPGCKKGTTMLLRVVSGNEDITENVLNYNGIVSVDALKEYAVQDDTAIICSFLRNGTQVGQAVYNVKAIPDYRYFHWDFTDTSSYTENASGGMSIASACDGASACMFNSSNSGVSFDNTGLTVCQTSSRQQFLLNRGIQTSLQDGYAIEFTLKLNDLSHGALIFGSSDSADSSKTIWGYFTSGKISRITLGKAGSMYFDSDNSKINYGEYATYRFVCSTQGECKLTVNQGDFSQTYDAHIQKGDCPQPEIDHFLPFLNDTTYFFDGTVKDFKIWTSYNSYCCFASGAHRFSDCIIKNPTCTQSGSKLIKCSVCGFTSSREKVDAVGHKAVVSVPEKKPTCTEVGSTAEEICSVCGVTVHKASTVSALGHTDGDADGICDVCGYVMRDLTKDCTCLCHKGSFWKYVWLLVNLFNRLININPVCACGALHY